MRAAAQVEAEAAQALANKRANGGADEPPRQVTVLESTAKCPGEWPPNFGRHSAPAGASSKLAAKATHAGARPGPSGAQSEPTIARNAAAGGGSESMMSKAEQRAAERLANAKVRSHANAMMAVDA